MARAFSVQKFIGELELHRRTKEHVLNLLLALLRQDGRTDEEYGVVNMI
jgi:hypothetical protein